MYTICKVDNEIDAKECDKMLTLLIRDEAETNENIDNNYEVKDYFINYYKDDTKGLFVAKDELGNLCGYVYLKEDDDKGLKNKQGKIDGLYVKEEYRKSGIGTNLIAMAKEWFKENNYSEITLNVLSSNVDALRLYEKTGFTEMYRKLNIKL